MALTPLSLTGWNLPPDVDAHTVFRSIFIAYPDAVLLVDTDGGIVLANPPAAELLGYTVTELQGLSVDALAPDAIRPRHAAYRAAYAVAPRPRPMGTQMDLVARRKDGTEVRVEIALSPLQDHGLPFVVVSIRDIGAYPRVQQALRQARYSEQVARLGQLAVDARDVSVLQQQVPAIAAEALQADMAAVYLREEDQDVVRVAGGVGLLAAEQIGARVPYQPDTSPGLVLSKGVPLIVEDYRTEQRFVVSPVYLEAGLVSALAVPISDRGQTIGALVVRSRQPTRFGDDELRFLRSLASLLASTLQRSKTEQALSHAQRLESVGQLTGGIAHDFNNLLTVIQGNLQGLEELPEVEAATHAQQMLAAAARASRRGAELTSKLLAFSRRQMLQPTAVDVGALLQSLAGMLRRTLDQRIYIEVGAEPTCAPVRADPGQLEAALLNIALNARDAMPLGGTLRFECGEADDKPLDLTGRDATGSRFVRIGVVDTGSGMSPEVRARAFEPFFTTKESGRGTGLGLSTVYGFAKQSRGAVTIESTVGQGTTLALFIPLADTEEVTAEAPQGDQSIPAGLRVLFVEDDAEVRSVGLAFLGSIGCEVTSTANAESALETLVDDRPFDLLFSDIALGPGMRGTQLAADAQRRRPALAVLLVSGYSAELLDADREAPPGWELLQKPYSRQELAGAIARALAGVKVP
jgi:PAS domain S-box-containing protein